jgi:hypothetical protein
MITTTIFVMDIVAHKKDYVIREKQLVNLYHKGLGLRFIMKSGARTPGGCFGSPCVDAVYYYA